MSRLQLRYLLAFPLAGLFMGALLVAASSCHAIPPAVYDASLGKPPLPARFIIFGDTRRTLWLEFWRRQHDEERGRVIRRIVEESPAFIVNTGDLVGNASSNSAWEYFDREHAPVRERKIPYYPVLGNHEYWGSLERARRNVMVRFPHLKNRTWYEVRIRHLMLLMLDSNFGDLRESEVVEQDRWLDERLEIARKDFTIRGVFLFCHHPPYTNSKVHGPSQAVRDHFERRAVQCPKVKALFCGHVHAYERFFENGLPVVVSGGGGAPLHELETDPKKCRSRDLYRGPAHRRFHYCACTLRQDRVDVEMFELDEKDRWQSLDRFRIDLAP